MATGLFDGVRELRSRLPEVPDTVIAYYLSKYNVEECYEKLKNGYDQSADMMDPDTSLYNSQVFDSTTPRTNTTLPDTRTHPSQPPDAPWGVRYDPSSSYFRPPGPPGPGTGYYVEGNPPYPVHDEHPRYGGTEVLPPRSPRRTKRISMTDPDSELVADQREQVEYLKKVRDSYTYDLTALRADAEHKRETLTALRLEVSEGPTKLDVASLQDIITTLEYDIHKWQNKVQVERTQAEMKEKLDVYTEEGVRWNCAKCGFLNHPLMTRCERCDHLR